MSPIFIERGTNTRSRALFNTEPEYMLVATNGKKKVVGFALGTVIEKTLRTELRALALAGRGYELLRMGIASMLFDRFRNLMEKAEVGC